MLDAGLGRRSRLPLDDRADGFAVRLDARQAAALAVDRRVALVRADAVRHLAGLARPAAASRPGRPSGTAAASGIVVGLVDTGIAPDSPLFSSRPGSAARPRPASPARCQPGAGLAGARPATASSRAPAGSSTASAPTGCAPPRPLGPTTTTATAPRWPRSRPATPGSPSGCGARALGTYAGLAPQARVAVYKACWTAPDPADDGCSTADLVTRGRRGDRDGVDVLNLSVAGAVATGVRHRRAGAARSHRGRDRGASPPPATPGSSASPPTPRPGSPPSGAPPACPSRRRCTWATGPVLRGAMASARGVARPRRWCWPAGSPPRAARRPLPGSAPPAAWTPPASRAGSCLCERGGDRPRRQVRGRPPRRRRRHGAGQRAPGLGRRRLPRRAHGPPRPRRRAAPAALGRGPSRGPGRPAPAARPSHHPPGGPVLPSR